MAAQRIPTRGSRNWRNRGTCRLSALLTDDPGALARSALQVRRQRRTQQNRQRLAAVVVGTAAPRQRGHVGKRLAAIVLKAPPTRGPAHRKPPLSHNNSRDRGD